MKMNERPRRDRLPFEPPTCRSEEAGDPRQGGKLTLEELAEARLEAAARRDERGTGADGQCS